MGMTEFGPRLLYHMNMLGRGMQSRRLMRSSSMLYGMISLRVWRLLTGLQTNFRHYLYQSYLALLKSATFKTIRS
jgi:hypothetical protein